MAQKSKKIIQPYIKHDNNASQDGKILRLCLDFRKFAKEMTKEELESFVAHGAYAIFWRILEFMHGNKLLIKDVELLADNLRIDTKFINRILNDYELFRIENDEYVSDRLLRDLERQDERSKVACESVQVRWLLSAFNKAYIEFFEEEAILTPSEVETLKKYNEKIPDLKAKFRDILYTLKNLKFKTDINFKPCANWLLKENHLARLLNGEFGPLKHKQTEKEIKDEQQKYLQEQAEKNKPTELDLKMEAITGKDEALEFIKNQLAGKSLIYQRNKLIGISHLRKLIKRFDITDKEVYEKCQQ